LDGTAKESFSNSMINRPPTLFKRLLKLEAEGSK